MANASAHSVYVFDGFRLDGDKLMLYRGEVPTALPPKAVETLAVLVGRRGEIVGKADLIDALWKDTAVEESNLAQYLYLIRKTLGTRPDGRPYIETLRKRGYRFDSDTLEREAVRSPGELHSPLADPKDDNPTASPERSTRRFALAASVPAALLLAAVVGAVVWFNVGASGERPAQLNVVRLTNGQEVTDAAVSPDGKYFAYHELDGGRSRIWVQQVGQSNRVEVVPWTDRWHSHKTFSPDGQFLFFMEFDPASGNNLLRVPTLGGPAVKIASRINSGVSFSPDGSEFVYYRNKPSEKLGEIVVRGADGSGDERVVHSWNDDVPGSSVSWSPDGRSIALSRHIGGDFPGYCSFFTIDISGHGTEPLSEDKWDTCYRVVWSPDGAGVYAIATAEGDGYSTRRDQLYYIPRAGGKARRMTFDGSRHQPGSLSVTNNGAVMIVPFNRSSQVWAMDASGDTRTAVQITTGLNDGRSGLAPMPDGTVAYITRSGENLSVWTMNAGGSDQRPLVTEPRYVEELRASGDGRYLYFSAPAGRRSALHRVNSDGTEARQVTSGLHVVDSGPSHDGRWIAYGGDTLTDGSRETSLWKAPTDGDGPPVKFAIKGCNRPHFSPDDRYLSCVADQRRIHVLAVEDGTEVASFDPLPRATLSFGARWSPDGKAIVYIVTEKDVSNLWRQPINGSPPRRLTDFTAGNIYHFAYSRDGKRLFLARGTQIRDAVLISGAAG